MLRAVDTEPGDYEAISALDFEVYRPGRMGLKAYKPNGEWVPLHRSTNTMKKGAIPFTDTIQRLSDQAGDYNYALVEKYDHRYRTMGYHSDCCFDSEADSTISVLSLYPNKNVPPRRLVIKNKVTEEVAEVPMKHGHVIQLSYEFNRNHLHKIVGESDWIGLTFAKTKTFIKFVDGTPFFEDGTKLTMATKQESQEFRKTRSKENSSSHVLDYPSLTYTISEGDLLM